MHPSEPTLLALCHGELFPSESAVIVRHASDCATCARRIEAMRRDDADVGALLALLDHPDVASAASGAPPTPGRRPASWRRHLVAASLALFVMSAVAVAFPRSPLLEWLRWGGQLPVPAVRVSAAPAIPPPPVRVSGVALGPALDAEVVFRQDQLAGDIRLVLSDTGSVTVTALGGRVGFRVGSARIVVDNRIPATRYDITVPRTLPRLVLRIAARPLIEIQNGRVLSQRGVLTDVPSSISMTPTTRKTP